MSDRLRALAETLFLSYLTSSNETSVEESADYNSAKVKLAARVSKVSGQNVTPDHIHVWNALSSNTGTTPASQKAMKDKIGYTDIHHSIITRHAGTPQRMVNAGLNTKEIKTIRPDYVPEDENYLGTIGRPRNR